FTPGGRVRAGGGLLDRVRLRVFAVAVFARLHRVDRDFGVPVVGGRDQDRVHVLVVEHLAVVAVPLDPARLLCPLEPPAIDVADRDDLDIVLLGPFDEPAQVAAAHAATADDGHADAVIGAEDAARGQGQGPGRGSGDERTARDVIGHVDLGEYGRRREVD